MLPHVTLRARAAEIPTRWPTVMLGLQALGWLVSLIGFTDFATHLISESLRTGGVAYDAQSYLLAGRHVLEGTALYAPVNIRDPGAFRYTPTFAVLMAPIALLPEMVVTWGYRLICLLCVRYLVGSWRVVGWSLLFPPLGVELLALNLTLPIAALGRLALRPPHRGVGWLPFAASLKYGSMLLMPYLWLRRPATRRALVIGVVALLGITAVHALLDPVAWRDFVGALRQQSASANTAPFAGNQLLKLVPSTLGDFVLRFVLAALLTGLAVTRRWDWLAFTAATLAVPTLWLARLAPLVGVPRLWWEDQPPVRSDQPMALPAPEQA